MESLYSEAIDRLQNRVVSLEGNNNKKPSDVRDLESVLLGVSKSSKARVGRVEQVRRSIRFR